MKKVQQSIVLTGVTMAISSIFLLTIGNPAFAVEYTNYTSEKYKIQFEYPSDWIVTEKTSRFESGADVSIDPPSLSKGLFNILYGDDDLVTDYGSSDIESATYNVLESQTQGTYEVRIIEKPSFMTIDNQKTGTFLITLEKKYEKFPSKMAAQHWLTFVGDKGYIITNIASTGNFDNPENMQIRDHFIKSIKFLDAESTTNTTNSPSRFD